jgi:hypothetical protein
MLKVLDHLPTLKMATICVHDDLDIARSVVKDLFCEPDQDPDPELVLRVRYLIREEEEKRQKQEDA